MQKEAWHPGAISYRYLRDGKVDLLYSAGRASPKSGRNASAENLLDKNLEHTLILDEEEPRIQRKRYLIIILALIPLVSLIMVGLFSSGALSRDSIPPADLQRLGSLEKAVDTATLSQSELASEGWRSFDSTSANPFQPKRRPLRPLRVQQITSQACADQWISKAELCKELQTEKASMEDSVIDVVWTWVAEDAHWLAWRDLYVQRTTRIKRWVGQLLKRVWISAGSGKRPLGVGGTTPFGGRTSATAGNREKHFRSHHEFRYSQRSVVTFLPSTRKLHLLATDLPLCKPADTACQAADHRRIGETPFWLDVSKLNQGNRYNLQYHWDLFKADVKDAQNWREEVLPAYNSLAIESQLPNVDDLADFAFYLNDDMYILRPLSPADIATPLFGSVFRMQKDLLVKGAAPGHSFDAPDGEWPGMKYSNWLLDNRFGLRPRPYLVHIGKTINGPLLDEVASVWADELKDTAGIRFRGRGGVEVNMLLLSTYYTVERHREALLWSFFVARSNSNGKGTYSVDDRKRLLAAFDGTHTERVERNITVFRPSRSLVGDVEPRRLLAAAHITVPKQTEYLFTSMDGYAFVDLGQLMSTWPIYTNDTAPARFVPAKVCTIDIGECFGSADFGSSGFDGDSSSQSLFKRMAFDKPQCGDCVIVALLAQNGEKGLGAFLPKAEDTKNATGGNHQDIAPPMLGDLHKSWQEADFSLSTILASGSWSRRDYAIRLLQRYSYVIGDTPTLFISLRSLRQIQLQLSQLKRSLTEEKGPAIIALNDDIPGNNFIKQIDIVMDDWHESMWPNKTEFEL